MNRMPRRASANGRVITRIPRNSGAKKDAKDFDPAVLNDVATFEVVMRKIGIDDPTALPPPPPPSGAPLLSLASTLGSSTDSGASCVIPSA